MGRGRGGGGRVRGALRGRRGGGVGGRPGGGARRLLVVRLGDRNVGKTGLCFLKLFVVVKFLISKKKNIEKKGDRIYSPYLPSARRAPQDGQNGIFLGFVVIVCFSSFRFFLLTFFWDFSMKLFFLDRNRFEKTKLDCKFFHMKKL